MGARRASRRRADRSGGGAGRVRATSARRESAARPQRARGRGLRADRPPAALRARREGAQVTLVKAIIVRRDDLSVIPVLFNPTQYTLDRSLLINETPQAHGDTA